MTFLLRNVINLRIFLLRNVINYDVFVGGLPILKVLKNTFNHRLSTCCQVLQELRHQNTFGAGRWKGDEASFVITT
jgi:hypothetical protein